MPRRRSPRSHRVRPAAAPSATARSHRRRLRRQGRPGSGEPSRIGAACGRPACGFAAALRPRGTWFRRAAGVAAAAFLALGGHPGATTAAVPLDMPITADWRGVTLRDWAERVAAAAAAPVVVDRRLDPETTVTLEARKEPVRRVLGRAAAAVRGDVAVLGGHVRLVPEGGADAVLAAERARRAAVGKLPPQQRGPLEAPREWTWADGARPADVVAAAAARANATLEGVDRVPHDHLPAAALHGLSAAELVDLVLAHYDLRVHWRAGPTGRPTAGAAAGMAAGRIIGIAVDVPAGGGGDTAEAAGGPRGGDKPPTRGRKPGGPAGREPQESFTLRAAAPLDDLLATVAKRLGLELRLDRAALERRGIAPGEIIRLSVADASRKDLLDAILGPLELRWRIADGRLEVPATPE